MGGFQSILDSVLPAGDQTTSPKATNPNDKLIQMGRAAEVIQQSLTPPSVNGYRTEAEQETGHIAGNAPQIEKDFLSMDPTAFTQKYGGGMADHVRATMLQAANKYQLDRHTQRSLGEALQDNVLGVAGTLGSQVLGAAGAVTSSESPAAGAHVAELGNNFDRWIQDKQSDALNAHREAQAARADVYKTDLTVAHQADLAAGDDKFTAALKNFGREVVAGAKTTLDDPMTLSQQVVDNAGSILVNYALTDGMGALAERMAPQAGEAVQAFAQAGKEAGVATEAQAMAAEQVAKHEAFMKVAGKINPMLSSGIQMGSGAFQQTIGDVLAKSHDDLMQTSQVYREHYQKNLLNGMSDDDAQTHAKYQTAGEAGRQAAVIEGGIAAATAHISHIQEHPFEYAGPAEFLKNIPKESLEMGLQNTGNQFARNVAIHNDVDPNQDLTENLGDEAGKGIVLGAASAAALGSVRAVPSMAVDGAVAAGKGTLDLISHALGKVTDRAKAKIAADEEATSPVSGTVQSAVADGVLHNATNDIQTITNEVGADSPATEYVQKFLKTLAYNHADEGMNDAPEHFKQATEGATNRIDAIRKVADTISKTTDPRHKIELASYLNDLMKEMVPYTEVPKEIMDSLGPKSETAKYLESYQRQAAAVEQMPQVRNALDEVREHLRKKAADSTPLTEQEINTPAGQAKINEVVLRATEAPETNNSEVLDSVLSHAEAGRIELDPHQLAALKHSRILLDEEARLNSNPNTEVAQVSHEIFNKTDEETKTPSARQLMQNITRAMTLGDTQKAKENLADLGSLVLHTKNKTEASNAHVEQGSTSPRVPYMALAPRTESHGDEASGVRQWYSSTRNEKTNAMFVEPTSERSIALAQKINAEHQTLTHVYNGLVDAYPQLGESKIAPTPLHPALEGKPSVVASEFKKGKRSVADFSEARRSQVEQAQTEQAQFNVAAPAESIVNKNVAEAGKPIEPEKPVKAESSITPEKAQTYSDKQINDWMTRYAAAENPTPEQQAKHEILSAEMQRRAVSNSELEKTAQASSKEVEQVEQVSPVQLREDSQAAEAAKPTDQPIQTAQDVPEHTPESAPVQELPAADDSTGSPAIETTDVETQTPMHHLFPDLVQAAKNILTKVFGLKKGEEPPTRTIGIENPAKDLRTAFQSDEAFRNYRGTADYQLTTEIAKAYQNIFDFRDELETNLTKTLNAFLKKAYKGRTLGEALLDGSEPVNRFKNGRVLNLVEPAENGGFKYNSNLIETATLGALHWFITQGYAGTKMEDEDLAKMTKISLSDLQGQLTAEELEALKKGFSIRDAKSGIANVIRQFWGLRAERNADISYADGIPEAMAGEILQHLAEMKVFNETKVPVYDNTGAKKDYVRFVPNVKGDTMDTLHKYSNAIGDAVLVKPERVTLLGSDRAEIPARQMHSDVKNTKAQQKTIKAANETAYKLNLPMTNLYYALGVGGILDLFAGGSKINPETTNVEHMKTLQGQNLTFGGAASALTDLVNQMSNRSSVTDESLRDMEIHYAHNMASNGRLFLLGPHNPQASKLMREAVLPTWATLDMTSGKHLTAFYQATAQALGIKVEQLSPHEAAVKANTLLQTDAAPLMKILTAWAGSHPDLQGHPGEFMGEDSSHALPQDLIHTWPKNIPRTPNALHALLENARLAQTEDKSNFHTGLYLEADGKTNGPINALVMLGHAGENIANWVRNTERGGLSFGPDGKPLHSLNKVDLYGETAARTQTKLMDLRNTFQHLDGEDAKTIQAVNASMGRLMNHFLDGFSLKDDNAVIGRGVAKSPLTTTMYGAGEARISENVAGLLKDELYAKLTTATRKLGKDETLVDNPEYLFPEAADPHATMKQFVDDLNQVLSTSITWTKDFTDPEGAFKYSAKFHAHDNIKPEEFSPQAFKFTDKNSEALAGNMRQVLVRPMREAIADVIGEDVLRAAKLIQTTSNKQSIVYSEYINNEIHNALVDRRRNDPDYRSGDFLSREKLGQIFDEALPLAPQIANGDQNIMMAKRAEFIDNSLEYSRTLNDRYPTAAAVDIPGPAGVAGMPLSIIGLGDASMMQRIYKSVSDRIMGVFDGLHVPLDQVQEYSRVANEAAYAAWMNNPVEEVRKPYFEMLKQSDKIRQVLDDQQKQAVELSEDPKWIKKNPKDPLSAAREEKMTLAKQLLKAIPRELLPKGLSIHQDPAKLHETLMDSLEMDAHNLRWTAAQIEGRHAAMREVGMSTDQMASAAAPFHNGAKGELDMTSPQTIGRDLHAKAEPLAQKVLDSSEPVPSTEDTRKAVEAKATVLRDLENEPQTLKTGEITDSAQDNGIDQAVDNAQPEPAAQYTPPAPPKMVPDAEKVREQAQGFGRVDKQSGVRLLTPTSVRSFLRFLAPTPDQKNTISQMFKSDRVKKGSNGEPVSIVIGSFDEIGKYADRIGSATAADMARTGSSVQHGWYSVLENRIYLVNPTAETITHELIHATTFKTVLDHYNGVQMHPEVHEAVRRLEALQDQFLDQAPVDLLENDNLPANLVNPLTNSLRAIAGGLNENTPEGKAQALNEFMAWTLANRDLSNYTKIVEVNKYVQLAKNVIQQIKNIFWGTKTAPKMGADIFSNVQFNIGILLRSLPSMTETFNDSTLNHAAGDDDVRTKALRDAFVKHIVTPLQAMPEKTETEIAAKEAAKALAVARVFDLNTDVTKQVQSFYRLSDSQRLTIAPMIASFATLEHLDPAFMNRAQEYYAHTIKNLTADDFRDPSLKEGTQAYDDDFTYAQGKYNILLGREGLGFDSKGRSTILPTFIALSMVSPEFQRILSKLEPPKSAKDTSGTLDAHLSNLGSRSMDRMAALIAGDDKAGNVKDAMHALVNHLTQHINEEDSYFKMGVNKAGGVTDFINNQMVSMLTTLSDKGRETGLKLSESNNAVAKSLGTVVSGISSLLSDKNAALAAEETTSMLNKAPIRDAIKNFAFDMIGRTQSNADIYDMIKSVKTKVDQLRQKFREQVPQTLNERFSQPLTDEQQTHLFHGLGKTDVASLMENNSVGNTLRMLTDTDFRKDQLFKLEDQIKKADPANFEIYQKKMQDLAKFMMTGQTSNALLKNAHAIAELLGEDKTKKPVLNEATVRAIDQATSLYAIEHLDADRVKALAHLTQNESNGMNFMLEYLHNTRKGELSKIDGNLTRYNHYKGFIPSTPKNGTSLKVVRDDRSAELRQLGYTRVAPYKGSSLDSDKSSRSYYFAPLNSRTAYAQGIMQNVTHTVSGIDSTWGFSTEGTAGRIVNPADVKRIVMSMHRESANGEHLIPLYNDAGQVFAFERAMQPALQQMREPSQNLSEMLGHWRGRQVEEQMSVAVNHQLIDNLYKRWQEDTAPGSISNRAAEYVNLSDSHTLQKVQQDAVSLFSPDTQKYIKQVFGEQGLMVRKDMLNDVIGYRNPSVGDMWTGNTNWSKPVQDTIRNSAIALFGTDAYKYLVKSENFTQGLMSDMRNNIVVRSMVIPFMTQIDNARQLISRGVPLRDIVSGTSAKLHEIHLYNQGQLKQIDLEAELWAASNDPIKTNKLQAQLQSLQDSFKRMSIYPLIERGEFTTIAGMTDELKDVDLSSGHITQWIESKLKHLPGSVQTAARYGMMARDTALYQGLERLMEYGDFISKSIFYDDLMKRQGMSSEEALGRVSEEFLNYPRLPGRGQTYTDSVGLTWFLRYKIRIAKIAMSMARNNPLHALIAASVPGLNEAGSVFSDNIFTKALNGQLKYSIGPTMMANGLQTGPWWTIASNLQ